MTTRIRAFFRRIFGPFGLLDNLYYQISDPFRRVARYVLDAMILLLVLIRYLPIDPPEHTVHPASRSISFYPYTASIMRFQLPHFLSRFSNNPKLA